MPNKNHAPKKLLSTARVLMLLIGLIIASSQFVQHYHTGVVVTDWFLWVEIAVYAIILPLAGFGVLRLVARSEDERRRTLLRLEQQTNLVRSLTTARGWGEIAARIVEYPHTLLPVDQVILWAYNPQSRIFDAVSKWKLDTADEVNFVSPCQTCPNCPDGLAQLEGFTEKTVYCLPLCLKGQRTGMLQMILPPGCIIQPNKAEILNGAAPQLSLALDRAQMHRSVANQQVAIEAERSHVARELHDTLAQNVALLRLKLEGMLLYDDPEAQISSIREELFNMQLIANEAYQQVRQTLVDLQPDLPRDLAEGLVNRARSVGERSGFRVNLQQDGQPHRLRPFAARETFRIFREALNNIEKHAEARNVSFYLDWRADGLKVEVHDDGHGYHPYASQEGLHLGMGIMHERAASFGGRLEVSSQPGQGTTLSLWVPAEQYLSLTVDAKQEGSDANPPAGG